MGRWKDIKDLRVRKLNNAPLLQGKRKKNSVNKQNPKSVEKMVYTRNKTYDVSKAYQSGTHQ
jgi:hypothetical protein